MSALTQALIAGLSDDDLDLLAELLAPRLAALDASAKEPSSWLRGADRIAAYIGAPRSRVYALASARRIPVARDGSALVARTADLDAWLLNGGARRP